MYDNEKGDNKEVFFAVDQEFIYTAPRDFCGLGVSCKWCSIDSNGNEGPVADCELVDGQRYVVNSRISDGGEESFYPEPLSEDDEDDE